MKKSKAASEALRVIARAPFHVYFEGEAHIVSAVNKIGPFDILPGHADFFSILSPSEVIIESEAKTTTFDITNGMISVRDNEVLLFINM